MELVEPYITNMQQAWIPVVGAVVVVLALIFAIIALASNDKIKRGRKAFTIVACALWGALFTGIEIFLACFAGAGEITGANSFFIMCAACVCAGGLSTLAAKLFDQKIFKSGRTNHSTKVQAHAENHGQTAVQDSPQIQYQKQARPNASEQNQGQKETITQKALHSFRLLLSCVLPIIAIGAVTLLCLIFLEQPANPWFVYIAEPYIGCEVAVLAGFVAGVWLIFQRRPIGFVIPMVVSLVYGLAEFFVETFKRSAIMPGDLRSANTGMSVAGGYSYEIAAVILLVIALFALATGAVAWLKDPLRSFLARKEQPLKKQNLEPISNKEIKGKARGSFARLFTKNLVVFILSALAGLYLIITPVATALDTDWEEEGIVFDYWRTHEAIDEFGIIPSFIAALQLEDIKTPDGYTHDEAEELQSGLAGLYDQYVESTPARKMASEQFEQLKPNVVLVMNESFADLSFMDGLGVGYQGPAFLRNMDAIAKGKSFVSVYGGNTCNSEFESLSGSSLGSIAGGINPYSVYDLSLIDSVPKQFKSLGYDTTAIHPEAATNWDRDRVYPAIGFDRFISDKSFEGAEEVREHVTDTATYHMVLDQLKSSDEPQFVFDLTMMGHGGYKTGLIPESERLNYDFSNVTDDEEDAASINEYLSSIRMSDEDIQQFLSELRGFDEPTVVVFFGDHQPGFSWWFKDEFANDSSEIVYQESMYQTDYFIWSNYAVAGSNWNPEHSATTNASAAASYPAIESDRVNCTEAMSPADLISWTLSYIGAPLTDYDKATYASRWWVQASNLYGFMDSSGNWHPESEEEDISGSDTFTQGMAIINNYAGRAAEEASDSSGSKRDISVDRIDELPRSEQDAIMANVMKWITYLNFAEKLK